MAFPTGWGRKCAVTIDNTKVSGSGSLTDFPVLVTAGMLPSEMFDSDGSYPALNGGGDVRFSSDSAGTTQLPIEVLSFVTDPNPANGSAQIWVKVPSVSGTADTTVYVWYNKTGESQPAVTDTYGRNAVWADYEAVLHMDTSGYVDSTGNGHTGTANSAPTQVTTGHPWGGTWTNFDGIDDYVTLGTSTDLVDGGSFTIQTWAVADAWGGTNEGVASNGNSAAYNNFAEIKVNSTDGYRVDIDDGGGVAGGGALGGTTGTTYLLHLTNDTTNGRGYRNGSLISGPSAVSSDGVLASAYSFVVGSFYDLSSGRSFDGRIGVVRARKSTLSTDWISTEYANQNSPSTFASAGTPESVGGVSIAALARGANSIVGAGYA